MMKRLRAGFIRYASVADAIAFELTLDSPPECRIESRIYITFRNIGGSRWPTEQQAEHAIRAAAVARRIIAADSRGKVRRRANRAIVISYEDVFLVRGCDVLARWQCVVPAS